MMELPVQGHGAPCPYKTRIVPTLTPEFKFIERGLGR
jgi:hypothetical protein